VEVEPENDLSRNPDDPPSPPVTWPSILGNPELTSLHDLAGLMVGLGDDLLNAEQVAQVYAKAMEVVHRGSEVLKGIRLPCGVSAVGHLKCMQHGIMLVDTWVNDAVDVANSSCKHDVLCVYSHFNEKLSMYSVEKAKVGHPC
jgi:hypothetical protein